LADGFIDIIVLDSTLPVDEQLVASELFGGGGLDQLSAVSASASGGAIRLVVGGVADSWDLEVTPEAPQGTKRGNIDGCLAILTSLLPKALLSLDPVLGVAPLSVAVDAGNSTTPGGSTIVSYAWDFRDGATAEGAKAIHMYEKAGRYPITLTVTNSAGIKATATRSVTVTCPPGDVSPWTVTDVGDPGFPGSSRKDGDCFSLCAGGKGSLSTADECHFVYREAAGDLVLTARIAELSGGASGAWAGLMFRESTDPAARFAALLLENGTPRFRARPFFVRPRRQKSVGLRKS
jgi:hypothetical protein